MLLVAPFDYKRKEPGLQTLRFDSGYTCAFLTVQTMQCSRVSH